MRSINYTTDLWKHYKKNDKAEIIFEKDAEGNTYPSMIHIDEKLRSPWVVAWTTALGPDKQAFNEVLDLTVGERLSSAGQATGS